MLRRRSKKPGLDRESPIVQPKPLHKVVGCTPWIDCLLLHGFTASGCRVYCRRRFAVCTLFEQSRSIFLMSATSSSQSIMMLRKQSLFPVFSAIILHSAIHPARPNVGSPSVFHFEKSNRLMPVSGPQALHKLAFGRQRCTQAVIWAGVSFSHASSHWRRCNLNWLFSFSGILSQRMQWTVPLIVNSMILLAPQAQG